MLSIFSWFWELHFPFISSSNVGVAFHYWKHRNSLKRKQAVRKDCVIIWKPERNEMTGSKCSWGQAWSYLMVLNIFKFRSDQKELILLSKCLGDTLGNLTEWVSAQPKIKPLAPCLAYQLLDHISFSLMDPFFNELKKESPVVPFVWRKQDKY